MLPQDLSTKVVNDVTKLSNIKAYGGVSFPNFSLLCPGGTSFGSGFIPGPATILLSWGFIKARHGESKLAFELVQFLVGHTHPPLVIVK